MNDEKFHEIKLPGCVVFISTSELIKILGSDPDIWAAVIQRGKAFKRAKENKKRYNDHISKFYME